MTRQKILRSVRPTLRKAVQSHDILYKVSLDIPGLYKTAKGRTAALGIDPATSGKGACVLRQLFDISLTNLDDPDPHHRIKAYMHSSVGYFGNANPRFADRTAFAQVVDPEENRV